MAAYYLEAARGSFLTTLAATCALLLDVHSMAFVGFCTDWAVLKGHDPDVREGLLLQDDSLAQRAVDIVVGILRFRCSSMSWHCSCWPGKLALFLSNDQEECRQALADLKADWEAWAEARTWAEASPFPAGCREEVPRRRRAAAGGWEGVSPAARRARRCSRACAAWPPAVWPTRPPPRRRLSPAGSAHPGSPTGGASGGRRQLGDWVQGAPSSDGTTSESVVFPLWPRG